MSLDINVALFRPPAMFMYCCDSVWSACTLLLRFFNKERLLEETSKSREDPFKEISVLQWLQKVPAGAPMFPYVLAVLENPRELVKVEQVVRV